MPTSWSDKRIGELKAENEQLWGALEKLKVLLPQSPNSAFQLVQDTLTQRASKG